MAETYVSEQAVSQRRARRDQRRVRVGTGQRRHPLGRRDLRRLPRRWLPPSRTSSSSTWRPRWRPASRSSSWTPRRTFPETLAFVDEMRARYGLNLTVTKPGPEAAAHPCGSEQCCQFRKVEPLRRAIAGKRAWMTSLKRSDGPTRADAPIVSWDACVRPGEGQPAGHVDRRRHHVVPGRPRRCRCTRSSPGAIAPSVARRRRVRWPKGRMPAPGAGPVSTSPSAACTPSGARPRQPLRDGVPRSSRPRAQVRPSVPQHRRAQLRRAAEAVAASVRGGAGGHRHVLEAGRRLHRQGSRRAGAPQVGRACTPSAKAAMPS